MRFYLTENLRPNDAGIMELGLVYTDRMAIPPGQDKFPLSGHCLPECTAVVRPHELAVKLQALLLSLWILAKFKGFVLMIIIFISSGFPTRRYYYFRVATAHPRCWGPG